MTNSEGQNVFEILQSNFWTNQKEKAKEGIQARSFPEMWSTGVDIILEEPIIPAPQIGLVGEWHAYRAKLEAHLLYGTYVFTGQKYIGTLTSPAIDMLGNEPGPGWEYIENLPAKLEPNAAVFIFSECNIKEAFRNNFDMKKLSEVCATA